jgi:hypothetical protein
VRGALVLVAVLTGLTSLDEYVPLLVRSTGAGAVLLAAGSVHQSVWGVPVAAVAFGAFRWSVAAAASPAGVGRALAYISGCRRR